MHFSVSFLYALCVTAQAVHDARAPIEDLSLSASGDGFAELTPLFSNPLRSNSDRGDVDRRDNPLAALLVRQSCPSGWGLCNDGICCPLGGRCCGGGNCCNAGNFCYANGCCRNNETGCAGNSCCPVNYTCCSGGGCCESGTYCTVVNGRRGCCENGKICTSGGGVVTTTRAPTPDPITQSAFPTTRTTATTTRTTATTSQTIIATSVVPSPTPAPGSSIIDITATDPRIIYRGSWQSVTSSCNSSSQARMATEAFSSFSLDFQGNAVYLSLSSNNAWYTVTVGGRMTTFGGFESRVIPSNCSLSFEQAGLPAQSNTIEVIVSGSSLDSSLADDQWSFALDKIVVASTDPADTTSARAAQSTVTGLSDSSASVVFKWATVGLAAGAAGVSVFFLF